MDIISLRPRRPWNKGILVGQVPAHLACCAVSAYVHARRHVRFFGQL